MTNENKNTTIIINSLCATVKQTMEELARAKEKIALMETAIKGWQDEVEALEKDEKELYHCRAALTVAENTVRDLDAQCKSLYFENERLKKEAEDRLWSKAPGGYNADPSL
jgi:peptidoglycan hydrolase CwlO-like protein